MDERDLKAIVAELREPRENEWGLCNREVLGRARGALDEALEHVKDPETFARLTLVLASTAVPPLGFSRLLARLDALERVAEAARQLVDTVAQCCDRSDLPDMSNSATYIREWRGLYRLWAAAGPVKVALAALAALDAKELGDA
jgi:hypothetical protein